jgi:hypothetical protein
MTPHEALREIVACLESLDNRGRSIDDQRALWRALTLAYGAAERAALAETADAVAVPRELLLRLCGVAVAHTADLRFEAIERASREPIWAETRERAEAIEEIVVATRALLGDRP